MHASTQPAPEPNVFHEPSPVAPNLSAQPGWPSTPLRGTNVVPGIKEEDLFFLAKNWRANAVRILHLNVLNPAPPHQPKESSLASIIRATEQALKQGLYVVIAPGASMDDHNAFFSSREYRQGLKAFWIQLTIHFKGIHSIAFDLMNEPHDSRAAREWWGYAKELTAAIRQIDLQRVIMVEPPDWGWPDGFKNFKPTGDANTVYSFHFYGPMDFTHQRGYNLAGKFTGHLKASENQWKSRKYPGPIQGENWNKEKLRQAIAPAIEFRDKYRVPVWCGEFGAVRWANGAQEWFRDLIDVFESNKIGWAYYSFREWHAMDIEMDANIKNRPTPRAETSLVRLITSAFNQDQSDK